MLTIEVELLTGRYAATSHHDRTRAEWPPHPARFFSALVAALHGSDPIDPAERDALLWLEAQAAPALDVDLGVNATVGRRDVRDVYVPVNDITLVGDPEAPVRELLAQSDASGTTKESEGERKKLAKELDKRKKKLAAFLHAQHVAESNPSKGELATAAALLPGGRTRQARTFPVVTPARATFAFLWNVDVPTEVRVALDRLCARVTRLGHSSSLVRSIVTDSPREPNLFPDDPRGDFVLRTVGPGQLARLERDFERHRGVDARVLPARPLRYGVLTPHAARPIASSVFAGEWILFERVGGARPLASRASDLTKALRCALLEVNGPAALPSTLSGHRQGGAPSDSPHVAFIACPFVGHEHADGAIQGFAIVVPAGLASDDRERLLRLIAMWEKARSIPGRASSTVVLGVAGPNPVSVEIRRIETTEKHSLRPSTWCKAARRFVTATPIALDRHPGPLRSNVAGTAVRAAREAEQSIAMACERIGLPRPAHVEVSLAPLMAGAQHVREYVPWPNVPQRVKRARVHAEIVFDQPVCGPVFLGAGRYFGLGICLPVPSVEEL